MSKNSSTVSLWVLMALAIVLGGLNQVAGHGRMLDPPGRSSMWRIGFSTPKNYDDNGLNCGGRTVCFNISYHFPNLNLILIVIHYRRNTMESIKDVAVSAETSGVYPVRDPTTKVDSMERESSDKLIIKDR